MRILITGGCGFVGSSLAKLWKQTHPSHQIVAFDNLKRRGSELNLSQFKKLGIEFVHGDIRSASDFSDLQGSFDLLLEASAEPSVHAGIQGSADYLFDTNLGGTIKCLEYARKNCGGVVFLSTSRVYPINPLRELLLVENESRFVLNTKEIRTGLSSKGISEDFPMLGRGFRSLYGTTKLASELICEEYVANFNLPIVINRCGVIAGRGQFGKTDQGVFTLWVARHFFGGSLSYTGFGGQGKQVRDLLHPSDLFSLIQLQIQSLKAIQGEVFVAGGGEQGSTSLLEYTRICENVTGKKISISSNPNTAAVDLPWIIMDTSKAQEKLGWAPKMNSAAIAGDIGSWLAQYESELKPLFA